MTVSQNINALMMSDRGGCKCKCGRENSRREQRGDEKGDRLWEIGVKNVDGYLNGNRYAEAMAGILVRAESAPVVLEGD